MYWPDLIEEGAWMEGLMFVLVLDSFLWLSFYYVHSLRPSATSYNKVVSFHTYYKDWKHNHRNKSDILKNQHESVYIPYIQHKDQE